jgi:hypothetical protein
LVRGDRRLDRKYTGGPQPAPGRGYVGQPFHGCGVSPAERGHEIETAATADEPEL